MFVSLPFSADSLNSGTFHSMPGFCFTQVHSSSPSFYTGKRYYLPSIGNNQGLPGSTVFLFIHATPLRHRQTLQVLAHSEPFVLASVQRITSPCFITITMLYHASGEHPSPCGLYDSLCTLRVGRSTVMSVLPNHATLGTGGWLLPTRQGLSPCKKHQALPGAHVGTFVTLLCG